MKPKNLSMPTGARLNPADTSPLFFQVPFLEFGFPKTRPDSRSIHSHNPEPVHATDSLTTAGATPEQKTAFEQKTPSDQKAPSRIIALVPAHNEKESIEATVRSILDQERVPDHVVVICDNCTDGTEDALASLSHRPQLQVVRTVNNKHRKSGALNWAFSQFCGDADLIVTVDADTILPANAVADWELEFETNDRLAGSSAKFTMRGTDFLTRLQRNEFARWTDVGLRRGWTSVLAGTACTVRKSALDKVAAIADGRTGPWTHLSEVEDFELTYQIRRLGYHCHVSPAVRAYTDSMKTLRSLWGQRMKWQVGTVSDLLKFGVNRYTLLDWWQQAQGILAVLVRLIWVYLTMFAAIAGTLHFTYLWLAAPVIFVGNEFKQAWRIPHKDKWDVILPLLIIPGEFFAWLRAAWFAAGWWNAVVARITGRQKDRWQLQYQAEEGGEGR